MPELAVIYDPPTRRWLRFRNPLEKIEIHTMAEVLPALAYLEERVEQDELFAAGFVSYEAAPAFDPALQTRPPEDFPLLHFRLFAQVEQLDRLPPIDQPRAADWRAEESAAEFARKVDLVRGAIARGESYQVNLTFPLSCDFPHDAWSFFRQLVHGQQAGGAGYLRAGQWEICSASPELFFTRSGDLLGMRPMKGTAPRGRTLKEDLQQSQSLRESPKNRAENIMILDMVRNDLGRLAPPGQVQTEKICSLEKYPTVWQLTSTVSARSSASLAEIFQALFPCASITGAPKAQTMKIIKSIESRPREIYTGTFGWIGPGRQARFNVAIRTLLVDRLNGRASYNVGAGITWDSDSTDEYRECLDKAAVLWRPMGEFALIETLRWTPGKGYFLLSEHLRRLHESADYFDIPCQREEVTQYLSRAAKDFPPRPQRVRLLLHSQGHLSASFADLEKPSATPLAICPAQDPVDSRQALLYHKTTCRQIYQQHLAQAEHADEVVLWNERGEVTECCTANLVVELDNKLFTPPLSSGLLPGSYRAFLLQRGILSERVLILDDLYRSSRIYLINAVRKWRPAVIVATGAVVGK